MSSNSTGFASGLLGGLRGHISVAGVLSALLIVFLVSKALKYPQSLKAVSHIPGFRVLFHPFSLPGLLLPTTWWNPGLYFVWDWRHTLYKRYGNDTISLVPLLAGPPTFYTANVDVARQVASSSGGRSFEKPDSINRTLLIWGMNLLTANGDVWRRHRRIMGPAFNNKLFEMVWRETLTTYREMISEEGWREQKEISLPAVQRLTFKLALLIIGRCGFGFSFTWSETPRAADGRMSVQEALCIVVDSSTITHLFPKWAQKLPFKRLREFSDAKSELMSFMQAQVAERKAELSGRGLDGPSKIGDDAFSLLVKANEDEGGKFKLDDEEVIGNVFIMLFAGHETTAHALAATLGFLSFYDDIQEDIYQHIISVVGHDRDPTYEEYGKLGEVLAAFYEALRFFPSGYIMVREAFEDTILEIPNPDGEEGSKIVPVPKGTQVLVDMIGVQYNPRYFDNPEEYKPSRWYGVSNESEAFTAFSIGPRTCIGRKFATTEAVCFLTMLLRDYQVQPALQGNETKKEWKNRVIDAKVALTLGIKDVPVKFVRRVKIE